MNKTYRSVWNESTQTWVPAQENAKGRTKGTSRKAAIALLATAGLGASAVAFANTLDGGTATGATSTYGPATAYGTSSIASGMGAFAAGVASSATGDSSVAVGVGATATTPGGVALGYHTTASGTMALSMGSHNQATGNYSMSLGGYNTAAGDYSNAVGYGAMSGATNSIALGTSATVGSGASNSIAIGNGAVSNNANSVALGSGASTAAAVGTTSGTIGGTTYTYAGTSPTGTVSVGAAGAERTITNVAAGRVTATSTDAVNGSQLYAADSQITANTGSITTLQGNVTTVTNTVNNIMNGGGIKYFHTNSTLADSTTYGADAISIGGNAVSGKTGYASQGQTIAIGANASAFVQGSIAMGNGAQTETGTLYNSDGNLIAIGSAASATGISSVALGNAALAGQPGYSSGAVAVGFGATALPTGAVAVGQNSAAAAQNAIALGNGANASVANSVALGNGATTAAAVTTASGVIGGTTYTYAGGTPTGVVSVGTSGATRQITNVAAGQVTATSTDAVNGSQLYAADSQITANTSSITTLNGQVTTLQGNVTTLQGNVTTLNGQITSINSQITNINGKLNDAVMYDSSAHTSVTLGGVGSTTAVALHNVANGTLSATSMDAVNGSQLYATNTNVTNLSNTVNNINNGGGIKYFHTNSTQGDSSATGSNSTAIGPLAVAGGTNSVAMGLSATASAAYAQAIGNGALASNISDMALGAGSTASGGGSYYATAVGSNSSATAAATTALGEVAKATQLGATALGANANALGQYAISVGTNSTASQSNSVAIGQAANASTANSVALGNGATTAAAVTTASGVIGGTTYTYAGGTPTGVVSVGTSGATRQITNVAAGQVTATSTDAVNGSELYATNTQVTANTTAISNINSQITNLSGATDAVKYDSSAHTSVTLGGVGSSTAVALHNVANGTLSSTSTDAVNGSQLYATNTNVTNLSNTVNNINNGGGIKYFHTNSTQGDSSATGSNSTAIGPLASASGPSAIAIGQSSTSSNTNTVAIGASSQAIGFNSEALGAGAQSAKNGDMAMGGGSLASGGGNGYDAASAMGYGATAQGADSVALGVYSSASAANATALGANAKATVANSVALGQGSVANTAAVGTTSGVIGGTAYTYAGTAPTGTVSVGVAGAERTITNVAAGRVTATSTDAVNGSQLYAADSQITANTNSITTLNGQVTTLQGNVTTLQGNVTTLNGQITSINSQITNLNGKLQDAVMYDSSAHTSVTLGGSGSSMPVTLHNVANGTLSAASTDAVNGSQLYATNTNVSNIAGSVTTLQGNVSNINSQITNINGKLNDAVLYDSSAHTSVTLGGSGSSTAVALHNVANGTLSASSTDAVNGSQLYATNTNVSNIAGSVTTLQGNVTTLQGNVSNINSQITNINGKLQDAVLYDSSAHTSVTLGGSGSTSAVALHNVANGTLSASSTDAVNGSQLYATNTNVSNIAGSVTTLQGNVTTLQGNVSNINSQITNINGKLQDAVLYDSSAHTSVTLGGSGSTSAVALHNVANGVVNASSLDGVNGSQLYALASSDAAALGGGSTVNSDGSISNPTYVIGGKTFNNVGGALTNLDGSITNVEGQITNINGKLQDAVLYDSSAHTSITLGGAGSTTAVSIHNVANGTLSASSADAVNGSQLYATNQNVTNIQNTINNINDGGGIKYFHTNSSLGDSNATGANSTAIGPVAAATATSAIAIGNGANAATAYSVALGNGATTSAAVGTASGVIGGTTYQYAGANPYGVVSVGAQGAERQITNVAAGQVTSSSTDAVNGSQLYATDTQVTANTTAISNIAGSITNIDGKLQDAVMYDSSAHTSVTLGGTGATSAVALHNVANGLVNASSFDAVNGSQLYALASSTADSMGGGSTVNGDGSISNPTYVIGGKTFNNAGDAFTSISGDITNINGTMADAVMYDSSAHDSVTLGGTGATSAVALHNVANGAVNASSLDAVNGSQLYNVAASTANVIGGGSTVNSDGSISNPTFILNGGTQTYRNVAGAITNLDGRVTQNTSDITNITNNINNGTIGLVQQDPTTRNITVAKDTDGTIVDFTGTAGTRVLTGVSNGAVNASSVDAVNGSQLYALASSTADSMGGGSTVNGDGSISNPTYIIGGKTFNNAGDAFTSISGDITNINGTMADAVMYDSSAHDSVTLGGAGSTTPVALHNVANGAVNASSLDAVNGSQLYNVAASTANVIGGGSTVNSDGSISNPTFILNGGTTTYTNVAGAITNLDGRVTQNTDDITNITNNINNGTIGLVQQDPTTRNITVAKDTDGTIVDFTGTAGTRVLTGVSNGAVNASSVDAVNGSQLYATSQSISDLAGDVTNMNGQLQDAVMYDSSAHDSVTLGGAGSTTPVALHNVANGLVNASSFDAVNGSQLYNVASSTANAIGGGSTVNGDGSISNPTFILNGGTQTYTNVAGAITNLDGRVTQNTSDITTLQGDITNINGQMADAVMYDSSAHTSVTLGGTGATSAVALHNVANGAVNASSFDAVNGSQLYNVASSTANAIGGGSTVNSDGSISNPTFILNGGTQTYTNVAGAITNLDGRVTQNTTDITNLTNNINNGSIGLVQQATPTSTVTVAASSGGTTVDFTGTAGTRVLTGVSNGAVNASSVDAVNGSQLYATQQSISNVAGQVANAVMYDSSAQDAITLGGSGSTTAVTIHNVAAGTADSDAVNVGQMNAALANVTNIAENATDPMFSAQGDRNTEAAQATGTHATAGGANSVASGDQSTAMGAGAIASGSKSTAIGAGSSATSANSVALGAGSVADRDNTVSVGSAGNERQVTNVAAGTAGTDAVNVNQLNDAVSNATGSAVQQATQQANAYTNQQIGVVRKQMNSLGAAAMAASSLIPNARAEGNFQMAAAAGTYGGETALAVGANWYVSDRLLLNAHVSKSTGGGSVGASVGATFGF